jgi:hypothetical protein
VSGEFCSNHPRNGVVVPRSWQANHCGVAGRYSERGLHPPDFPIQFPLRASKFVQLRIKVRQFCSPSIFNECQASLVGRFVWRATSASEDDRRALTWSTLHPGLATCVVPLCVGHETSTAIARLHLPAGILSSRQPAASTINAIVIRSDGCSPTYGTEISQPIHAIMARMSDIRKMACLGAFRRSMAPPIRHRTQTRCYRRVASHLLQIHTDNSPATATLGSRGFTHPIAGELRAS